MHVEAGRFQGYFVAQRNFELPELKLLVDTLVSSLWCLLHTDCYRGCMLQAVNLGEDTDTVGAVTGGLAGLYYGLDAIPEEWLSTLSREEDIETLCERLYEGLH